MNKVRLQLLLRKYVNNTCSESELEEFLDLLKRADYEPEIKAALSEYWKEISEADIPVEVQNEPDQEKWFNEIYSDALAREESGFAHTKTDKTNLRKQMPRKSFRTNWLMVAATIVISALLSVFFVMNSQESAHDEESVYLVKAPEAGEKIRFTLSDGTQVHLNSESKLTYPKNFDNSGREVELEGEAYFVVASDENRPFTVQTHDVTTRVLGTSFNIRSYPDENEVIVAVSSGKVALTDQHNGAEAPDVVLEANQWANYSHETREFKSESGNISAFTAWNEGVLYYHDETLEQVAAQLERWYGVSIAFENDVLKSCVIRGEHRDESLVNVLNAITYAFSMDYEIEDRQVILAGNSCR